MPLAFVVVYPDGTGKRIFASGLRNPVGMDWEPRSGELWTAVNERDGLGDELVPDYITDVHATVMHQLGLDDMRSFGDSTDSLSLSAS